MLVKRLRLRISTLRQKLSTVTDDSPAWQETELASLRRDAATYHARITSKRDARRRFLIVGPTVQLWVSTPEEVTEELGKLIATRGAYAVNEWVTVVDRLTSPVRPLTPKQWSNYLRRGKTYFA